MNVSSIDYSELIIAKKGVISSDSQDSGNIIGEREDSIIVDKGPVSEHVYIIPKSKIGGYNGAQILLNIPYSELSNYEEKRDKINDSIGKVTDTVSDTVNKVSEKVTDTVSDTVDKVKDVFTRKDNNQ
ncbi:MAG: hypothetical protein M3162_07195 [Thermoproteota archaeon]|nr:hypothetical protein [Thermoproteota archaeon]